MPLRITNGINQKTVYITSNKFNEIYFPLKDSVKVEVNEYNVEEVADMIKSYYDKANFIIDVRLEYMFLVLDRMFPEYITVFNIYNTSFEPLNKYISSSSMFNIPEFHLYTNSKEKIVDMYLIIKFACKGITWRMTTVMNVISQSTLLDLLLNYIGFEDITKVDMMEKANKLRDLVDNGFKNKDKAIQLFQNKNELMNALILLRDNNIVLKTY